MKLQTSSLLLILLITVGCRSNHSDVPRVILAIEVPLKTPSDDTDLVAILRNYAAAHGMHVDDDSQRWREFQRDSNAPANTRMSIYVGMWRGSKDEDMEVGIDDMGHLRRAWVSFYRGGKQDLPAPALAQILRQITNRWSDAVYLPALPSGGLPLESDLRRTPSGYKIAPGSAERYDLPATSPLLAR